MSIEKPYQPSEEEMNKAEEMMTDKEKNMSEGIESGYNLNENKEKLKELMGGPVSPEEHALILRSRLYNASSTLFSERIDEDEFYKVDDQRQEPRGTYDHNLINRLVHIGEEQIGYADEKRWDKVQAYTEAYIHEFIALAKEYLMKTNLKKEEKLRVMDILEKDLERNFQGVGGGSEYRVHKNDLKPYFDQIKKEIEGESK